MSTLLAFRSIDPFTQDEFAAWIEALPHNDHHRYELLDGFIIREPPAGYPHGEIGARIVAQLDAFVRARGVGKVFDSSQGFALPSGDTVEPDVSFVSAARWRTLQRPVRGFPRVAPDLVFEILSPGTHRIDRIEKRRIYARNGVTEYVWVDAERRTLTPLHLVGDRYRRRAPLAAEDTFASRALPGLVITVASLFPDD